MEDIQLTIVSNPLLSCYMSKLNRKPCDYLICRNEIGNDKTAINMYLSLPSHFKHQPIYVYEIDKKTHYRRCPFSKEGGYIQLMVKKEFYYLVVRKKELPEIQIKDVLMYCIENKLKTIAMKWQMNSWK